jgi:O-antigen ligase
VAYGLNNAIVQWAALAVLAASFSSSVAFCKEAPISFRLLCMASIALPLLQLVPLPSPVWQTLPGRELVTQSLLSAQIEPGWRPLTVNSARTLVAALALLVPLALILAAHSVSNRRIQHLGWIIVSLGLLNFLWGIPQVLSQGASAIPYPENPMPGVLFGSFANRNSTAVFLVVCLILALHLDVPAKLARWAIALRTTLTVLLLAGVILTQSRTGIALLALPFALTALRMLSAKRRKPDRKLFALGGIAVAGLISIAVTMLPGSRIETALDRFAGGDGYRTQIWEDAAYSAERFWPVGAGMGAFDEVIQIDESLEHISPRTAGRAHNEYIELAIEGGVFALVLLALWFIWVIWLIWRARRSPDRWLAWSGGAILLAFALQSLTDYPLRNLAMLANAALATVLLVRFSAAAARKGI